MTTEPIIRDDARRFASEVVATLSVWMDDGEYRIEQTVESMGRRVTVTVVVEPVEQKRTD